MSDALHVPAPRRRQSDRPSEPQPRLRLVQPSELSAAARQRRARRIGLAVTALVGFALFGVVSAHVVLSQSQLELERLSERAAQQEARFQRLRLQVAELESPQRVVAVAQQRLGMVPPPGVTYLSPTGATAGEVRSVAGETADERQRPSEPDRSGLWAAIKAQLGGV